MKIVILTTLLLIGSFSFAEELTFHTDDAQLAAEINKAVDKLEVLDKKAKTLSNEAYAEMKKSLGGGCENIDDLMPALKAARDANKVFIAKYAQYYPSKVVQAFHTVIETYESDISDFHDLCEDDE